MTIAAPARRPKGEGSLYRLPSGRWTALVDLGRGPDGRRIRRRVTGRTRTEAARKLAEVRRQAADGHDVRRQAPTVGELATAWLARTGEHLAPSTRNNLRVTVERHLVPALGGVRVDRLTPDDVERWLTRELAAGRSRSSLTKYRQVLGQVLRWGQRRRLLTWNPAAVAELPQGARGPVERQALDPEQVRALLAAVDGDRLEAYWLAMVTLGVRPGELDALPWSAVDLDAGTIVIAQAVRRLSGRPIEIGPTKTRTSRVLALPLPLVAALRRHRARQAEERLALGAAYGADPRAEGLVFTNEAGGLLDPSNMRRSLACACKRAGLPVVSPYVLRHTAATLLVDAGLRPFEVADLLGHADLRMLEKHYRHRLRPVVTAAVAPMEALVAGRGHG